MASPPISCNGCHKQFKSKNELFRHLDESAKTCLTPEEYRDYFDAVISKKREKIGVLFGYLPSTDYQFVSHPSTDAPCGIEGGQHAAWLVEQAIDSVSRGVNGDTTPATPISWSAENAAGSRTNRSYGSVSRQSDAVAQDPHTGAITELLCTKALPLSIGAFSDESATDATETERAKVWVESVNRELDGILAEMRRTRETSPLSSEDTGVWSPGKIRVFGRAAIPKSKFDAETDSSHRRIDYCFPADLLYASEEDTSKTAIQPDASSRQEFFDSLPTFPPGNIPPTRALDSNRPDDKTLAYFYRMKKVMKRLTTQVEELDEKDAGAVFEKKLHDAKRKKKKQKGPKADSSTAKATAPSAKDFPVSSMRLLRRKRFHNFCPNILAHDYLAFRRVDRIFHRASIRLEESSGLAESGVIQRRPFFVFSLSGDLFLQEQAVRIMGLLIAVFRGLIDDDIIDCVFDEDYTNLIPSPPAPHIGLIAGEAQYMKWEGRMKTILNARRTSLYDKGWNEESVVKAVEDWEKDVLDEVARSWYCKGVAADGRLQTETEWLDTMLYPWAKKTRGILEDYRRWKASKAASSSASSTSFLPSPETLDRTTPPVFEKVLMLLRKADKSGMWPSTTPNRQLVMVSTSNDDSNGGKTRSLSSAHMAAQKNSNDRACAYSFKEGEGGASGSFSVGAMPGEQCSQPKGNLLFPELVKAAFELEVALCPDREPSSTIAINRNAQFRPHTDNGAGAGQSKSLIVGLGDYSGGELMVEGAKKDIRYKATEFDGWKER
ncbi:hypothetical protein ACHAXT_006871 [Thalassiosira profunda]